MDSFYIMRNLLMIFCHIVVFWTNLGNCEARCDEYTQCFYDETRMNSNVSCDVEIAGNTAPPCYGDGSIITCSCKSENYQLSSYEDSYLCRPDKWEDGLYDLQCLASPCDEPAPPDDKVFHSPDFAEGEMYPNGTEIMYDCLEGRDLNGHMTAVCLYGVWTYEDAFCTGFCDKYTQCHYAETLMHSTVSCNIETARGNTEPPCYGDGSNITCSCDNENYQLSSPNNSYLCRPDKWEDGLYDLYCLPPCDEPAPPDDLVFHSPDFAEGEKYANGTEIMYDCPDGLDLNGNINAVCLYGVWTYEDAYCTASPCDEPAPPDDLVYHSPDYAEGEKYANGTEIMYDCPDGLNLNGNINAVCLYGVWTYEDANCTAPAHPTYRIKRSLYFARGEMYANGTEIMYDFPEGWDFIGNMTAVCLYGVWTYFTVSPCDKPAPPDDLVFHSPDYAEGEMYANGTEIMYDCPEGWDFNGNMTAVCLYGVWTHEDAYCTDRFKIPLVIIIAIFTLLFAVLLIWLVKKHCLRRGTEWIPSVEGVANEQLPPTANDESKFVSKVTFEMSDPNGYQNDVNKEDNDVTDHVGDNSRGDLPNNDPKEETV